MYNNIFVFKLCQHLLTEISFGQTVQRITEATQDLEKLTTELSLQQDTVHQWVSDVQQWTSGTLKKLFDGIF